MTVAARRDRAKKAPPQVRSSISQRVSWSTMVASLGGSPLVAAPAAPDPDAVGGPAGRYADSHSSQPSRRPPLAARPTRPESWPPRCVMLGILVVLALGLGTPAVAGGTR